MAQGGEVVLPEYDGMLPTCLRNTSSAWLATWTRTAGRIFRPRGVGMSSGNDWAQPSPPLLRPAIPVDMTPWNGGEGAPSDWNGDAVQFRSGAVYSCAHYRWKHTDASSDIVAYTPKPAASTGEGEHPSRYHLTDDAPLDILTLEGMKKLGKGWLVISETEYAALSQPPLSDSGDDRLREALTDVGRKLMAIEDTVPIAREAQSVILAALSQQPAAPHRQIVDAPTPRESRCVAIADQVVPRYRDETKPPLSCTGAVARMWQAAYDGAWRALGGGGL